MEDILKNLYSWSRYFHVQSVKTENKTAKENLKMVAGTLAKTVETLLAEGKIERGTMKVEKMGQGLMSLWRTTSSADWQRATIPPLGFEGTQVAMNLGFFRSTGDKMVRHKYKSMERALTLQDLEKMTNRIGICAGCDRVAEVEGVNCPFCRKPISFKPIREPLYGDGGSQGETPKKAGRKESKKGPCIEEGIYEILPPSMIFFLDPEIKHYLCSSCGYDPLENKNTRDFRCRDLTSCPSCRQEDPKPRAFPKGMKIPEAPPQIQIEPEPEPEPEISQVPVSDISSPGKMQDISSGEFSTDRTPSKSYRIDIDFLQPAGSKTADDEVHYELPQVEEVVSGVSSSSSSRLSMEDMPAPEQGQDSSRRLFDRRSSLSGTEPSRHQSAMDRPPIYPSAGPGPDAPPLSREFVSSDISRHQDTPVFMEFGPTEPAPWPVATGSIGRTGQGRFSGPLMGHVKWSIKLTSSLNTPPVVGPEGNIFLGTVESGFVQIRPDSNQGWVFHIREPVMTPACIGNRGAIYFGSHNKFFCLNTDGSPRWVYRTGSWHAPLVDKNENIYIVSQTDLYCLHPDGRLRWTLNLGESAKLGFDLRPAMDTEGNMYITTEVLNVISPKGKLAEKINLLGEATPPAVDSQGRVYLGEGGVLKCLRRGSLLWSYQVEDIVNTPPAVTEGGYVAFGVREEGKLYYLNPQGKLKWSYNIGDPVLGTPMIDSEGNVFCLTQGSKIFAVSFEGQQLWQLSGRSFGFMASTAFNMYPACAGEGLMYVTALDGRLIAIE